MIFKNRFYVPWSTLLFFCSTMASIKKEQSQPYLHYPKKIVAHVITQKTLAHATTVIKSIHNKYGLNYNTFEGLRYIKLFKHPLLINCLYNIESTNSLEPVFFLWDAMGLLIPPYFLYEYALLVFLIYKDVLCYVAFSMQPSVTKNALLTNLLSKTTELYNKIEALPLHEIIMIINLLSEEMPTIIHDHMGESSTSWHEWFKKHWLKLSVALFTLLIKIIVIFKDGEPTHAIDVGHNKPNGSCFPVAIAPEDILKKNKTKKDSCISRILYPLR